MLIGTLPAAAGPSISPAMSIQLTPGSYAGAHATADRDSYAQKARAELQEWQQKLHDFSEKAEAAGRKDTIAAEHDLNEAWKKTEAEARKLQTASAAEWESAKISYEKASRELADAWHRIAGASK